MIIKESVIRRAVRRQLIRQMLKESGAEDNTLGGASYSAIKGALKGVVGDSAADIIASVARSGAITSAGLLGGAASSAAGGLVGLQAGGAAGAVAGSLAGPPGTLVGALIGAGAGGLAGSVGGFVAGGSAAAGTIMYYLDSLELEDKVKELKKMLNFVQNAELDEKSGKADQEFLKAIRKVGPWTPYLEDTSYRVADYALNTTKQQNRETEEKLVDLFHKSFREKAAEAGLTVKSGGTRTTADIVKAIQVIIGEEPATGKWTKGVTDQQLSAFITNKNPDLEGATVKEINASWKTNGPKITKVNNVPKTFTGDAAGLLSFLQTINVETAAAPAGEVSTGQGAPPGEAKTAEPSARSTPVAGLAKVFEMINKGYEVDTQGAEFKRESTVWRGAIKGLGGPAVAATYCIQNCNFTPNEEKALSLFASSDEDYFAANISTQTFLDKVSKYFYSFKRSPGGWGPTANVDAVAKAVRAKK